MSSFKITRRQFLKWVSASAAVLGLSQTDLLKIEESLATMTACTPTFPSTLARVIWLTGADCGGCPTSLLNYLADPNDPDPVLHAIANNAIPGFPLVDIEALTPQGADGDIDIAEIVTEVVTVDWHYIIMAASGDPANQHMAELRNSGDPFVLAIDGAIQTAQNGKFCTIFSLPGDWTGGIWDPYVTYDSVENRTEFTMAGGVLWLASAPNCIAVVADGTCASFGGVPAASASLDGSLGNRGNLTGAKSAWEWINGGPAYGGYSLNKILVNIPGCPPHSDWQVGTIAAALLELLGVIPGILLNNLDTTLDHKGRPKLTYTGFYHNDANYTFCQNCPRNTSGRPGPDNLCAAAKSAANPNGLCLENRGCNGWMVGPAHIRPDCPTRKWNKFEDMSKNNWCVGNNMPCQGCASPGFPDYCSPFYKSTKYRY
jgi:hydrogenase small subunit